MIIDVHFWGLNRSESSRFSSVVYSIIVMITFWTMLENFWREYFFLIRFWVMFTLELNYQFWAKSYDSFLNVLFSKVDECSGTDVEFERKRLGSVNILICTPGRLLQHMDENEQVEYYRTFKTIVTEISITFKHFQLNCDSLLMLIIDEADRILDMGFKKQVNWTCVCRNLIFESLLYIWKFDI